MITKKLEERSGLYGWAQGCEHCRRGIMNAPGLNELSTNALYVQRAIQAAHHEIDFCECKAGVKMRAYLLKVWREELKGRAIPDDTPVPTIHYEQVATQALQPVTAGGAAYA